jgi:hypothetical protein
METDYHVKPRHIEIREQAMLEIVDCFVAISLVVGSTNSVSRGILSIERSV